MRQWRSAQPMVSTGAVGFAALIFLTMPYMVSQFDGGWISTEPSSCLIFFAGCRRCLELVFLAFVAVISVLIVTSFLIRFVVETELILVVGVSDIRLRFLARGSRRSSISSVFADDREESSLGSAAT